MVNFLHEYVWASSPLCFPCALVTEAIIYSPTKACSGESGSHGELRSGATATYSGKIYHLTPAENFVKEMNS